MRITRALVVASLLCASLVASSPNASAASLAKTCASLEGLQDDLSEIGTNPDPENFDLGLFEKVGKSFTKAAKTAPKSVKSSLKKLGRIYKAIGNADNGAAAAAALGRDAQKYAKAATKLGTFLATDCAATGTSAGSAGGAGASTLVLGDETIALDQSRCFLEEQTAAGQKIELTAQANGTTSDGMPVTVDFTRYARGGQFEGDDTTIDVGDPRSGNAVSYHASLDLGTVELSGSTLRVSGVEARDGAETVSFAFEIHC